MTEDEFRASEYNSLLKLQKEEEYSDEPAGTIVKQNPKAAVLSRRARRSP